MHIAPKTVTEDLIDQLNALIASGRKDNQILIQRIKKQSDDLLKIDAFEAYIVKGILASYHDRPFAEVSAHFDRALMMEPNSCLAHLNYSIACCYAGLYSKELFHIEKARGCASNPRELDAVASSYPSALSSSFKFLTHAEVTGKTAMAERMSSYGVSEDDLALLNAVVEKVHSTSGYRIGAPKILVYKDDMPTSIVYTVDANADQVYLLTNAIFDELLNADLPENLMQHFTVGYVCA